MEAALDVYYTSTDNVSENFADWTKLTTDASGKLTVDTNALDAGEYIFAVAGQKGSTVNAICSVPGGVILTVEKSGEEPEKPVRPVVPGTPSTPSVPETPSFTDISGHWASPMAPAWTARSSVSS